MTGPPVDPVAGDSVRGVRDEVAIVTGAGSGIGQATARRLANDGTTVVCVDVDRAALTRTVQEMVHDGLRGVAAVADVAVDEDCRLAVAAAADLGRIRALVNVAGIMAEDDRIDRLSEQAWNHVLAVNLGSVFFMSRHTIPLMRQGGGGVIVNTGSVHAYATCRATASYAASKGAIVALTRQMALDYADDLIRVVAVAPGSVDTPMSRRAIATAGAASFDELGFSTHLGAAGRVGQPHEVAEAIAWLTSGGASFVNGTTLAVDGGLLARLV